MERMSFLDFLLAEALIGGLRRDLRDGDSDGTTPKNFFVLPKDDVRAWQKIHEACKKDNMVIVVEFTDNVNDNCRRVRPLFVNLAREFEGIPFMRVVVTPGSDDFFEVSYFLHKRAPPTNNYSALTVVVKFIVFLTIILKQNQCSDENKEWISNAKVFPFRQ